MRASSRVVPESALNHNPKALIDHSHHLPALLDMPQREKKDIFFTNVISGFSLVSAPVSVVEANVASIPMAIQISSLGFLGLTGNIAGFYRADKQIKNANEKIIRLNKELFLLFNVTADKFNELQQVRAKVAEQNAEKSLDARKDLNLEADAKRIEKEYYEMIIDIQLAISSPITESKNIIMLEQHSTETDVKQIKYTSEVYKMAAIVEEYDRHRNSALGKKEKELWELLKTQKITRKDHMLLHFFLNYSSEEHGKEFFHGQRKGQKEIYKASVKELQALLLKAEQENNQLAANLDYIDKKNKFILALQEIYNVANAYAKKFAHDKKRNSKELQDISHFRGPLSKAYIDVYAIVKPFDPKRKINDIWLNNLYPLIAKVEDNFVKIFTDKTRVIPGMTPELFGEQGSFRKFWRALPSKSYEYEGDMIPLNFEQSIHRGGSMPSRSTFGMLGLGVGGGLFATGKGLYIAAIALGAAAIGATGMGLLVGGIAIALALLCLYYFSKIQKANSDRNFLLRRLQAVREPMLTRKPEESMRSRAANATYTGGSSTFFGSERPASAGSGTDEKRDQASMLSPSSIVSPASTPAATPVLEHKI